MFVVVVVVAFARFFARSGSSCAEINHQLVLIAFFESFALFALVALPHAAQRKTKDAKKHNNQKEAQRQRQKTTHTHTHKYCSWLELLHLAAITVRLPFLSPPLSCLTEICMKLFELFMHMASTATPPMSAHTHTHTRKSIAAVKTKRKRKTGKHTQRSRRRCQSYSYEKYLLRKPINCKKTSAADAGSGRNALVKFK